MVLFMMPAVGSIFPLVVPLALMSIASEDDREYMVALYLKYNRRLFAYALKITRNWQVAEDAVHDAFVSLISNVSELRQMEGGRLEGYVFVTVKNAAFMIVRKERTMARAEYEAAAPDNTSDEKFFISAQTTDALMTAIGHLSEKDQLVLQMRYFQHLSYERIAGLLGIKESNARKMVSRAVHRLTAILKQEE